MRESDFKHAFNGLHERTVRGEGSLPVAVRQAICDDDGVPDPARDFADKVHRHAHKVTDEDVRALLAAGYSEDAVFEATICAAVGAALVRWQAATAAMPEGGG